MNKDFLKRFILAMLGGSQTEIELSETDLDMVIYHTINYYGANSNDAWNEEITVLRLTAGTNMHEVPDDVDFIISINQERGGAGISLSPESPGNAYENAMLGMMQNDNSLQTLTNVVPTTILYRDGKRYFQTDMILQKDTNVAAKVLKYKDLSAIYGDPWVQKYALAQAKFLLGIVRSKFSGVSSPNDMSMNGSDLISQAQAEIEKLEQSLFDTSVISSGGIYIG